MEPLGYRFFRGRQGASGFARRMAGGCAVRFQGLRPAETYCLRALPLGDALGEERADGEGCAAFQGAFPDRLFLSRGDQVILWDGDEAEFLRAGECLKRLFRPQTEESTAKPMAVPAPEENAPANGPRLDHTEETAAEEPPPEESLPEDLPDYTLRPENDAPPVDALPKLIWPSGTEHLREYFDCCPPIRLFDEPLWRFVRVPSPIRQAAYCAVGRHIAGDRVDAVAYAVPGGPYNPPAPLPGYRYRPGRGGMGYWVLWKQTE